MSSTKRPTPVEVVIFPPRPRRSDRARTQTLPELKAVAPAEPEFEEVGPRARHRTPATGTSLARPEKEMAALGHELLEQGRPGEARLVFEGLVEADPGDGFAHTMLGTVHLMLAELGRAEACFDQALAIDPNDVPARVYRGELRLKARRFRPAAEDFTRALSTAASSSPFHRRARRLLTLAQRLSRRGP